MSIQSIKTQKNCKFSRNYHKFPDFHTNFLSVMEQKKETYDDLLRALEVMRYVDDKTPKSKIFYAMYLLEVRQLSNIACIHVSLMQNYHYFQLIFTLIIERISIFTHR